VIYYFLNIYKNKQSFSWSTLFTLVFLETASGLLTKHFVRFIDLNLHANRPPEWFAIFQLKSTKQIAFACSIPRSQKRRPINGSEQNIGSSMQIQSADRRQCLIAPRVGESSNWAVNINRYF